MLLNNRCIMRFWELWGPMEAIGQSIHRYPVSVYRVLNNVVWDLTVVRQVDLADCLLFRKLLWCKLLKGRLWIFIYLEPTLFRVPKRKRLLLFNKANILKQEPCASFFKRNNPKKWPSRYAFLLGAKPPGWRWTGRKCQPFAAEVIYKSIVNGIPVTVLS